MLDLCSWSHRQCFHCNIIQSSAIPRDCAVGLTRAVGMTFLHFLVAALKAPRPVAIIRATARRLLRRRRRRRWLSECRTCRHQPMRRVVLTDPRASRTSRLASRAGVQIGQTAYTSIARGAVQRWRREVSHLLVYLHNFHSSVAGVLIVALGTAPGTEGKRSPTDQGQPPTHSPTAVNIQVPDVRATQARGSLRRRKLTYRLIWPCH
jgi:hypothetical protein